MCPPDYQSPICPEEDFLNVNSQSFGNNKGISRINKVHLKLKGKDAIPDFAEKISTHTIPSKFINNLSIHPYINISEYIHLNKCTKN